MTQKKTYCNSRVRKALAAIGIDYSIALIDGLHCRTCRFANTVRIFPAIRGDSTWLFCEACRNSGSVIDYAKDGLTKRVLLSDEQNNRSRRRRRLQAACEKAVRLLGQHTGDLDTAPGLATAAHIYIAPQRDWDMAFMDQCILQQRRLNLSQFVSTEAGSHTTAVLPKRPYMPEYLRNSVVLPLQDYPGRYTGFMYLGYENGNWKQVTQWFDNSRHGLCLLESLCSVNPYSNAPTLLCTDLVLGLQLAAKYASTLGETMRMAIYPWDVTAAKANKSKLTNLFSRLSPQPIAFGREESKTAAIAQYCGLQAAPAIDFDFDLPIPVLLNNLLSAVPSVAERYACVQS